MSSWHYNDKGAQRGPISTDDLKAKIVAGEISGLSLVWQVGTKDWAEVREFPELVTEIHTPPPLPKSVTIPAGTRSFATVIVDALPAIFVSLFIVGIALAIAIPQFKGSGAAIALSVVLGLAITIGLIVWLRPANDAMPPSHALRRFFAKTLDVEIASLFGFVLIVLFRPGSPSSFFALYLIGAVGLWGAMDIGLRGKTLGRKLFGVVIEPIPNEGGQPSYFTRFVKMNVFGLALGIPLFSMVAMAITYKRMREDGIASWDKGYFKVGCSSGGMWKITIGILLITLLAGLQGVIAKGIEPTTREKNIDNERADISSPTSTNHNRQGIQWKNALTNHSITLPAGWSETQFPKNMIDGYMEQFRPKGVDTAITLHSDPSKKTWDEVLKDITQEHALPNGLNIDRVIGPPSIKKIGQWTVVAANIELLLDREMKPNYGRLPNFRKLGLVDGKGNYWNISLHENKVKEIVGQQCALIRGLLKTINLSPDEIDQVISLQGYCVG